MKILGIDYGDRRIGLAVCDQMEIIASPLSVLDRRDDTSAAAEIGRIARENDVELIVLGFPLNMNGTHGPMSEKITKFGDLLKGITGLPVQLCDERLSTTFAEKALIEADMRRDKRKGVRDKVAAQVILQGFLDRRANDAAKAVESDAGAEAQDFNS